MEDGEDSNEIDKNFINKIERDSFDLGAKRFKDKRL